MADFVLLFDLDDTLLCYEGVASPAWDAVCSAFALENNQNGTLLREQVEQVRKWYWSSPRRHKRGRKNMLAARERILFLALCKSGIPGRALAGRYAKEMALRYTETRDALMHLFPDSLPVLWQLRAAGYRLGLVTNGTGAGQREKLARFNLEEFFEYIFIEQEAGFGKPDPRIYKKALAAFHVLPENCLMVGDNPAWDVYPALRLGMRAVWFNPSGRTEPLPLMQIKALSELPGLLEGLPK